MPRIREKITFGIELEAVQCSGLLNELANKHNFTVRRDNTILDSVGNRAPFGREVITPILSVDVNSNQDGSDMEVDFGSTTEIINDLCRCATLVNTSCGIHIHLGCPDTKSPGKSKWRPEALRTFLVVGSMLESRLFDLVPESRKKNPNCKLINEAYTQDELLSYYPLGEILPNKRANKKRYCWMNLVETKRVGTKITPGLGEGPATNTVEIRLLGNTRRANYIWAWTRFWVQLAAYVAYVPTSLAVARYSIGADAMLSDVQSTHDNLSIEPDFNAGQIQPLVPLNIN